MRFWLYIFIMTIYTFITIAEDPAPVDAAERMRLIEEEKRKAFLEAANQGVVDEDNEENEFKDSNAKKIDENKYESKPDDKSTKDLFNMAMDGFLQSKNIVSPDPCNEKQAKKINKVKNEIAARLNYDPDTESEEEEKEPPQQIYGPHLPSQYRPSQHKKISKKLGGQAWVSELFNNISNSELSVMHPAPEGIAEFCPKYDSLDKSNKDNFWHSLMMGMAYKESNFNTDLTYREKFGVTSSGLFQISLESGKAYKKYGCDVESQEDLHNPSENAKCALAIFRKWIIKDKTISEGSDDSWKGPARYWSVLRNKKPAIIKFIRKDMGAACF